MTAVGFISDTEEIIKASWSNFQNDGMAAFELSEISPLPPALSAKGLPGGRTQVLNIGQIRRIDRHPSKCDEDRAPESISNTENWLNWTGDLDNPNESEDNCGADDESDIEWCIGIKASESPEHRIVSATSNVPGLIRPTQKSMKQAQKWLVTVSAKETRRNKGNKKKQDRLGQYVFTRFYILLDREFHWKIFYGRIMSSCMRIFVHKEIDSWQNAVFKQMYQFWLNERGLWKNICGLGFTNWLILNRTER